MSYSILHIVGSNSLSVRSRLDLKFLRGQCMGLFAEAGSVLSKKDDQAEQKWARHQKNITSGLEKPGPRVEVGEEMPQFHSGQTEESLIYWRIRAIDQCQKQAQNWLHPDRGGEPLHSSETCSQYRSNRSLSNHAGIAWVSRFLHKRVESMLLKVHAVPKVTQRPLKIQLFTKSVKLRSSN